MPALCGFQLPKSVKPWWFLKQNSRVAQIKPFTCFSFNVTRLSAFTDAPSPLWQASRRRVTAPEWAWAEAWSPASGATQRTRDCRSALLRSTAGSRAQVWWRGWGRGRVPASHPAVACWRAGSCGFLCAASPPRPSQTCVTHTLFLSNNPTFINFLELVDLWLLTN